MKTASRPARLPGLDGLRAIAIVGVVLYHAGVSGFGGGFLGVDLFFVISGFLITSLLFDERLRTGRVSLPQFYRRRVRRLLPALFTMLALTTMFMALFFRADLGQARGDIAAAIGYVANWWFVLHHRSYFAQAGRQSPFEHLWSLSIEEQFYLVWPLVLVSFGVVGNVRRRAWLIGAVASSGAIASALWMRSLAIKGNVPFDTDSSRIYFGTDTHASALLLGAAAAAFVAAVAANPARTSTPARTTKPPTRDAVVRRDTAVRRDAVASHAADVVGVVALGAVCWAVHAAGYYTTPGLFRGGFFAFAAACAVVVVAAARGAGRLGRLLDIAPLRWIGARSYGLYLWHWPVIVYTRPGLDWPLHGAAALGVRLVIIVALTEASYRLIEVPVRSGEFARRLRQLRRPIRLPDWLRVVAPVLSAAVAVLAIVGATAAIGVHAERSARSEAVSVAGQIPAPQSVAPVRSVAPKVAPSSSPVASELPAGSSPAALVSPTPPAPSHPAALPAHARPAAPPSPTNAIPAGPAPHMSAFGDSVMLDASASLRQLCPSTEVYAVVGWQERSVFAQIEAVAAAGHLGPIVVIETGTNGIVSAKELDAMLTSLADRQQVIVINNHMDRAWEPPNNAMFPVVVKAHRNAVLVDWDTPADTHPNWLTADGVHLTTAGRGPYAQLIKTAAGC